MPLEQLDTPRNPKDRLSDLLDKFRQARADLQEAAEQEVRLADLGKEANKKWGSLLRERPELASGSMSELVPEQEQIEHIHQRRKDAEWKVTDLRRKLMLTLRLAAVNDSKASAVLNQVQELLPFPTLDVVDTTIGLLDELLRSPSQTGAPTTAEAHQDSAAEEKTRGLVRPFPTPEGATWGDVCLRFTSENQVQITVLGKSEVRTYVEMGFEDRRRQLPNQAWQFLRRLAENKGFLQTRTKLPRKNPARWVDPESVTAKARDSAFNYRRRTDVKSVQQIRHRLQAVFGLPEDPFELYYEVHGYKTRFKVECASSYA